MPERPSIVGPKRTIFPDREYADNFTKGFSVGQQENTLANVFDGIGKGLDLAAKANKFITEFGPEGVEKRRLELEAQRAQAEVTKLKSKKAQIQNAALTGNEQAALETENAIIEAAMLESKQKVQIARSQASLASQLRAAGRDLGSIEKIWQNPDNLSAITTDQGKQMLEASLALSNATGIEQKAAKQRMLDYLQGTSALDRTKVGIADMKVRAYGSKGISQRPLAALTKQAIADSIKKVGQLPDSAQLASILQATTAKERAVINNELVNAQNNPAVKKAIIDAQRSKLVRDPEGSILSRALGRQPSPGEQLNRFDQEHGLAPNPDAAIPEQQKQYAPQELSALQAEERRLVTKFDSLPIPNKDAKAAKIAKKLVVAYKKISKPISFARALELAKVAIAKDLESAGLQ